jgi:hypothetical protein
MALAVQTASIGNSNATSATNSLAWASNLTIGNLVVCVIALSGSAANPSPTVSSVSLGTDSLNLLSGGTISNSSSTTGMRVEMWASQVIGGNQKTLTVNVSTAANIQAQAAEYNGGVYTLNLDGIPAVATGNSVTLNTGNLTTGNTYDLLITGIACNSSTGPTSPTNLFTEEVGSNQSSAGSGSGSTATGNCGIMLTDFQTAGSGLFSTGGSQSTATNYATVFVALQLVAILLVINEILDSCY